MVVGIPGPICCGFVHVMVKNLVPMPLEFGPPRHKSSE